MKKIVFVLVVVFIAGCTSVSRAPDKGDFTTVSLTHSNYRVLKQAAQGRDTGFRLLGFIPIVPVRHGNAMANLYKGVSTEGRSAALVNVSTDRGTMYLILFSLPSITITADVVEFIGDDTKK